MQSTTNLLTFTAALAVAAASAFAQAQPADFPADAKALAPEALKERLAGKVFHVAFADGMTIRLQYQGGYYYVDTSRGARVHGTWRVDGSKVCTERAGRGPECDEARLVGDVLHFKRQNGEIVKFEPR